MAYAIDDSGDGPPPFRMTELSISVIPLEPPGSKACPTATKTHAAYTSESDARATTLGLPESSDAAREYDTGPIAITSVRSAAINRLYPHAIAGGVLLRNSLKKQASSVGFRHQIP
jgi:hypothetical protein